MKTFSVVCALALVVSATACSKSTSSSTSNSAQPAAAKSAANAPDGSRVVNGTVQETMNAAGYTYARVKSGEGDIWAAAPQMTLAVGDKVTVPLQMAMKDFHSPTLKRDFPVIYFVTEIQREGAPAATPQQQASAAPPAASVMASHGGGDAMMGAVAPAPPVQVEKMAPPAGGMSIADVWAKKASLADKTVTVRGKVVKYNPEILGRNWIHIQDGSGNAKQGTNDLTVTSNGATKVGDVITATGKVSLNKDFGAGYVYGVILDGATIK